MVINLKAVKINVIVKHLLLFYTNAGRNLYATVISHLLGQLI
jgi:hypothetical protein